ncbi:hypothetical protein [Enterobacter hormaechei]|nr:hypothetical protein [Enterobacter hormaechei]
MTDVEGQVRWALGRGEQRLGKLLRESETQGIRIFSEPAYAGAIPEP